MSSQKDMHNICAIEESKISEIRNIRCELVSGDDVSFLEGKLKTIIESMGVNQIQEKAVKNIIQSIVWEWFNYICDSYTDSFKDKSDWYKENKLGK